MKSTATSVGHLLLFLLVPLPTMAATTVVNCTESELRSAVSAGGVVTIACDGTIVLTDTIAVTADTILDASGRAVIISGNNAVRCFYVHPSVNFAITNLTIALGRATNGAAIHNDNGSITLINTVLRNNSVFATNAAPDAAATPAHGGAIYNRGGQLRLINGLVSNNVVTGWNGINNGSPASRATDAGGGAIFNDAGTLIISNSLFAANLAQGGNGGTLMLSGGYHGGVGAGGALFTSGGTTTVWRSQFHINRVQGGNGGPGFSSGGNGGEALGGAISVTNSVLGVSDTLFNSNVVASGNGGRVALAGKASGGGIHTTSNSMSTMRDCSFVYNRVEPGTGGQGSNMDSAEGSGGGVYNAGNMLITRTAFSTNIATGGRASSRGDSGGAGAAGGGALFNGGVAGITESGFVGNNARGGVGTQREPFLPPPRYAPGGRSEGGAIFNIGRLSMTNSALWGNVAEGGASPGVGSFPPGVSGRGTGGGLGNSNIAELLNVTFAQNSARDPSNTVSGGAGSAIWTSGMCALKNSIVAQSATGSNCFGTLIDRGHNISSDNSCAFTNTGSLNSTDPVVGFPGDFGGPTWTVPLLSGSPALDAADSNNCPQVDQRGRGRPYGSGCDIGAFESSPPYTIAGNLRGFMVSPEGRSLSVGGTQLTTDARGNYRIAGVPAGNQEITWMEPALIVPARTIVLGPDALHVDFVAYRTNRLSPELLANGDLETVWAGAPGVTWRLQASTDLTGWTDVSTNTTDSHGIFRFVAPATSAPIHLRAVRP